mgnify:CR=1 FL=1
MWRRIIDIAKTASSMLHSGSVPPNSPARYKEDLSKINFLASKKFYVVFCSVIILAAFYVASIGVLFLTAPYPSLTVPFVTVFTETIKILGPDGVLTEGKEAHSKFLEGWFKAANPKWSNYFSVPVKVNWEEQPGTWVTNGHNLTLTIDGVESTTGNIADVYIEDGLGQMFYVFSRELPAPVAAE